MTKSTWQSVESKGGQNVNYFFSSMARGCGTYLSKGCACSAPEIQISTSFVRFYTKKKAEEETFLVLSFQVFHVFFFLSSASSGHPQNLSFFNLLQQENHPHTRMQLRLMLRAKMLSPLLMSMANKDFGGIMALFFQTSCGYGFSVPNSWHCSLRFLPPIPVNWFYQKR